jgi:hypothetical protein
MDQETFARHVGEALSHIDDHNWLARCPLRELASSGNGNSGEQLARLLMTTIKQLRPAGSEQTGSPEWRQCRHLLMRYVLGACPRQIAQELNISDRQARRDHLDGLQELSACLWRETRQSRTGDSDGEDESSPGWAPRRPDAGEADHDEAVSVELARMGVAPASGPTLLEEAVRGIVTTASRLAASRGITFATHFPHDPCFVAADQAVLRQILLNLLTYLIQGNADTIIHLSL